MLLLRLLLAAVLSAICAAPALATFPGRNGEIAFVRNGDIWAINADGTALHRVTTDPGDESAPAWSPDGSRIAFSRQRNGNRDIWTAAPDGSDARQVTTTDTDEYEPAWAPDGRRLVYSRFNPDVMGGDLYIADSDGRNERFIHQQRWGADWQPGGERIAAAAGLGDNARLAFVGETGQDYGDLPTDRSNDFGGGIDGGASWAPDGSRLVYSRLRYDEQGVDGVDLVVNAFSRDETAIDEDRGTWYAPTWSPDGTAIAFEAASRIWVIPARGGQAKPITNPLQAAGQPAWRPLPPVAPVPVITQPPLVQAPATGAPIGVPPARQVARIVRLTAPKRLTLGRRLQVLLRLDARPSGRILLQRRARGAFRTVASASAATVVVLRFRPPAAGRLRIRVVIRTGGTVIRRPLSVLVRP